jgi:hypothetical protein
MHSSNGPAKRLNPHNFVKRPLVASQQQANKYNIKDPNIAIKESYRKNKEQLSKLIP